MLREQLDFTFQQRTALQRPRQNRAPGVAVVVVDGATRPPAIPEYSCAVPSCAHLADTQCNECSVWVCDDHGPNHDRHMAEVDETVIAAYLEHIASLPVSSSARTAQSSGGSGEVAVAETGHGPRPPNAQSKEGCKTLLRQMGVSEQDIRACNDNLRMLQALRRAKQGGGHAARAGQAPLAVPGPVPVPVPAASAPTATAPTVPTAQAMPQLNQAGNELMQAFMAAFMNQLTNASVPGAARAAPPPGVQVQLASVVARDHEALSDQSNDNDDDGIGDAAL